MQNVSIKTKWCSYKAICVWFYRTILFRWTKRKGRVEPSDLLMGERYYRIRVVPYFSPWPKCSFWSELMIYWKVSIVRTPSLFKGGMRSLKIGKKKGVRFSINMGGFSKMGKMDRWVEWGWGDLETWSLYIVKKNVYIVLRCLIFLLPWVQDWFIVIYLSKLIANLFLNWMLTFLNLLGCPQTK